MQYSDNLDAVIDRPVENKVVLKSRNRPTAHTRKSRIVEVAGTSEGWYLS
jgi:hypothetical protein